MRWRHEPAHWTAPKQRSWPPGRRNNIQIHISHALTAPAPPPPHLRSHANLMNQYDGNNRNAWTCLLKIFFSAFGFKLSRKAATLASSSFAVGFANLASHSLGGTVSDKSKCFRLGIGSSTTSAYAGGSNYNECREYTMHDCYGKYT